MASLAEYILSFFESLELNARLPSGVQVLNPYKAGATKAVCSRFYGKYYSDTNPRIMIVGINPGRLGGGLTGIPFTDPIRLEKECGIENSFDKKPELSSEFIYKMIGAFGGPQKFYHRFYFTSVCPLGFTKEGKNINYYDIPALQKAVLPFILECIQRQLQWNFKPDKILCLGEGDNYKFLSRLNDEHNFFQEIIPLPHPRFIMQYKRKSVDEYVDAYLEKMRI